VSISHLPSLALSNVVSTLQHSLLGVFYRLDDMEKDSSEAREKPSKNFLADLTDIESLPG
jgi:hypothetical protein